MAARPEKNAFIDGLTAAMFDMETGGRSERVPLLGGRSRGQEQQQQRRQQQQQQRERDLRETFPEPDAVQILEKQPLLLVRAVAVFTMTTTFSCVLAAIKTGVSQRFQLEWSILPVCVACVWLTVELVFSFVSVRRVMIREQRLQRVAIRRIRRQHSRQTSSRSISFSERGGAHRGSTPPQEQSLLQQSQRVEALRAAPRRRGWARGEIPSTAVAAAAGAGAAAAAAAAATRAGGSASSTALTSDALSAADVAGVDTDADTAASDAPTPALVLSSPSMSTDADDSQRDEGGGGEGWWSRARSGEGREEEKRFLGPAQKALTHRSSRQSRDFDVSPGYSVGDAGGTTTDGANFADASDPAAAAAAAAVVPGRRPSRKLLRRQESDAQRPMGKSSDVAARAARVSCLLQSWTRLWLSMAIFSVTLSAFTLLLSLRLFGVPASSLSTGAIASPGLVMLSLLALHSVVMLDGERGSGGGAANRQGGARSRLGLNRRPIIVLSLLCVALVVAKLDSYERDREGKSLSALSRLAESIPWWCALSPVYIMAALIEVVYLIALWENRTGESVASTLMGGAGGTPGCLTGWGGACGDCECPAWGRGGDSKRRTRASGRHRYNFRAERRRRETVSYSSSVRRRVELTPRQRAAAASLVPGILCLTVAMLVVTIRRTRPVVSWSVPMTILMAAAGMALVGTGLGQLAAAFCSRMRGPLPVVTTPLPVFFCERQGGWVAGPPDPPTVSIFLLGEVTLRQESFALGSAGALEESGGGSSWGPSH